VDPDVLHGCSRSGEFQVYGAWRAQVSPRIAADWIKPEAVHPIYISQASIRNYPLQTGATEWSPAEINNSRKIGRKPRLIMVTAL
jgi:hypothetical protein